MDVGCSTWYFAIGWDIVLWMWAEAGTLHFVLTDTDIYTYMLAVWRR